MTYGVSLCRVSNQCFHVTGRGQHFRQTENAAEARFAWWQIAPTASEENPAALLSTSVVSLDASMSSVPQLGIKHLCVRQISAHIDTRNADHINAGITQLTLNKLR